MSFPLTISFDNASPSDCPVTFADMITLLNALISGTLEGEFLPYVTGAATPGVDDQDKVWMRVDTQGRPIGTYVFYSGTWRRQYDAPVGMIVAYSGDPAVDFAGTGHAGTIGGQWDGWQLCSGENGSPNLSDKFIVGAKMDDLGVGYPASGDWTSTVAGTAAASGDGGFTSDAENTFEPATNAVTIGHWKANDGSAPDAGEDLLGLPSGAVPSANFDIIEADPGNPTPDPIITLPPWIAFGYAIFTGY